MRHLTILVTITAAVFLLSIKPLSAFRILEEEKEDWMIKKANNNNILVLQNLQKGSGRPPGNGCTGTPGQGGNNCKRAISQKGFAGRVRVPSSLAPSPPQPHVR